MEIYVVKAGDTLWKIAKRFGSTVEDIERVNGIENADIVVYTAAISEENSELNITVSPNCIVSRYDNPNS